MDPDLNASLFKDKLRYPVVFRVEANGFHGNFPSYDGQGGLRPRYPDEPLTLNAAHGHLTWRSNLGFRSPFTSLYWSWEEALHKANWFNGRGAAGTRIFVVDFQMVEQRNQVFDAHILALNLGFPNFNGGGRPNARHHRYELLVYGAITAPDNTSAVLAIIPAGGNQVQHPNQLAKFGLPNAYYQNLLAKLVANGAAWQPDEDELAEDLSTQMIRLTGDQDPRKVDDMMMAMCLVH